MLGADREAVVEIVEFDEQIVIDATPTCFTPPGGDRNDTHGVRGHQIVISIRALPKMRRSDFSTLPFLAFQKGRAPPIANESLLRWKEAWSRSFAWGDCR